MAQFAQALGFTPAEALPSSQRILPHAQRSAFTFSGDTTPPLIANLLPVPGSEVARSQALTFDVTDADGFGRVIVSVKQGAFEFMVHDGDDFLQGFAVDSTRLVIAGGWSYSVIPDSGWDIAPTIRIFAVDAVGNETPP